VDGGGFQALSSEGEHSYFPFLSEREFAFQTFYREKSGEQHITGNLVASGYRTITGDGITTSRDGGSGMLTLLWEPLPQPFAERLFSAGRALPD